MCRPLKFVALILPIALAFSCTGPGKEGGEKYKDQAFLQDYSVKYFLRHDSISLKKVACDRNGNIKIMSSHGLMTVSGGSLLYPGEVIPDRTYLPMTNKKVSSMALYQGQFVYADGQAVFGNAWAGTLYTRHGLPEGGLVEGGPDFSFLMYSGKALHFLDRSSVKVSIPVEEAVLDLKYDSLRDIFWVLMPSTLSQFHINKQSLEKVYSGKDMTCFALASQQKELVVGTSHGYFILDADTYAPKGEIQRTMPWPVLNAINEIGGMLWFGSDLGAFMLREDGKYNYYHSKRWLPSEKVIDIEKGEGNSVLLLSDRGLAHIQFKEMTLYDKALFYENQVRKRHIRHGFNASTYNLKDGNVDTGTMEDSDNDGLWTSMYLASQVFRFAVTSSDEALRNCEESMEAMERLYSINPVKGFPSRSFERRGYKYHDEPWRRAEDPEWDWKSTTSSDEAIGHIFAFGVMAELMSGTGLDKRAIVLMDSLMTHIVENGFYLIDWNGQPTRWGRWHPDYVNAFLPMVGDRKLNSSNIIGMLQTAYHFTHKEIYREKAFELMEKHGYLKNMMRPMAEIGRVPASADALSLDLSEGWNHSDDEMYFLGYWGLYRYAFNDTLKAKYKASILDHWRTELPEKEGAWNIFTAMVGEKEFGLDDAVWYLREYPLDLITWTVRSSHRMDIQPVPSNFRRQTIREVLPPDELRISRHNANRFDLDGDMTLLTERSANGDLPKKVDFIGEDGTSEYSAGDIWLLPYWMGRYLGIISAPEKK